MSKTTSVAMTGETHRALCDLLVRADGQEDLCLATYRRSTGRSRVTALLRAPIPPEEGERVVHGNVTVHAEYILRAAALAQEQGCGLVMLHSHPAGRNWQPMSGPDHDAEQAYAHLVRELTGLPLVGMTLAAGDRSWSARHWDTGIGRTIATTECANVRVVDDQLWVTWNDSAVPRPRPNARQVRTLSAWGEAAQWDLARRSVLVVGVGSVGLDVAVRLMASGLRRLTVMDFDEVEARNLDRLIGATHEDAALRRPKIDVARREALRNATADDPEVRRVDWSICEEEGLLEALDHDLIFCCVDRPWPRAVLNSVAYTDLIPVIDGGIAIDTRRDGTMRNATWRSHILRPGRPCMVCSRQLDMGDVALDVEGLLDDPEYIAPADATHRHRGGHNVALLSVGVSATLLAQYVSFSVAPGGLGDPGPLRYHLNTHEMEHVEAVTSEHCVTEAGEAVGDERLPLTGRHDAAERARHKREAGGRD